MRMVLELVSYGDLFAFIHPKVGKKKRSTKKQTEIDWKLRYKILLDIAEGMRYLHHSLNPPIIHRDLRSPNIFVSFFFFFFLFSVIIRNQISSFSFNQSIQMMMFVLKLQILD